MINAELLDSPVLSRLDQPCRDAERALEGLEDAAVGIDAKIETQGAITSGIKVARNPPISGDNQPFSSRIGFAPDAYLIQPLCVF